MSGELTSSPDEAEEITAMDAYEQQLRIGISSIIQSLETPPEATSTQLGEVRQDFDPESMGLSMVFDQVSLNSFSAF